MHGFSLIWRLGAVLLTGFALFSLVSDQLPAGFSAPSTYTHVEIDGVDFGPFDRIDGLEGFSSDGLPIGNNKKFAKITLTRDFVTYRSLYLWAKQEMSRKFHLKDIHLVTAGDDGTEISRRILKLCQPLSWSVETTNPSLGGFNETIDLAVQKVSRF